MFVKKLSPLAQALRVASEMAIADDDDREDRHDMSPMNAIQQPSTPPTEEEELRANQLIEGTKQKYKKSESSAKREARFLKFSIFFSSSPLSFQFLSFIGQSSRIYISISKTHPNQVHCFFNVIKYIWNSSFYTLYVTLTSYNLYS